MPVPVAPRQIPFHAGFAYFELDQTDAMWEQLKNSGGIGLHVAGEFPGLAHGVLGDPRAERGDRRMAEQRRSVQPPDPTSLRPRPGGGQARRSSDRPPMRRRRRCRSAPDAEPLPRSARAFLGHRPESARAGGQPAAAARRADARDASPDGRRRPAPARARRDPPVRGAGARGGRAERDRCSPRATRCAPASTRRCCRRRGAAQSEWAQHPLLVALHREAWGGEKFFEMLERMSKDPGRHIDLMELQYLLHRVRLHGQVPRAGARPRAAGRGAAGPLSHDPQQRGRARARAVAAVARPRGPAQPARPLRAVVGGRARRAADPGDRRSPSTTRASPASRRRCRPSSRGSASKTSPPPQPAAPVAGPDAQAAARARGTARRADRRGGGRRRRRSRCVARRPVPVGQRDGESRRTSRRCTASPRRSTRCRAACGSSATPTTSRSGRCASATTTSCRASARSASSNVLQDGIDNRGEADAARGVGVDRPRYQPESDPENRARNRRVEIVHVRGG